MTSTEEIDSGVDSDAGANQDHDYAVLMLRIRFTQCQCHSFSPTVTGMKPNVNLPLRCCFSCTSEVLPAYFNKVSTVRAQPWPAFCCTHRQISKITDSTKAQTKSKHIDNHFWIKICRLSGVTQRSNIKFIALVQSWTIKTTIITDPTFFLVSELMYTSWAKFLTKFHRNSTGRSRKKQGIDSFW